MHTRRLSMLTLALLMAALATGPPTPASAANCDGLPGSGGAWSGEYTMTDNCTLTGAIYVDGSLTIHGNGHTIDANGNQAFDVGSSESLALDNVTVANAYAWDGSAIYNEGGTVTVSNSAFSGNFAGADGGAIDSYSGTVTITGSTFSGNSAGYNGGAIENGSGMMTVSSSTFAGNSTNGSGGAIANLGTMIVSNSTFTGNSADYGGGAVGNYGGLTVGECSVFQGNTAGYNGDGIDNSGGTVDVTSSTIYDEVYHNPGAAGTTAEGNWWGSAAGPGALAVNFTVSSWLSEVPVCAVALPKCIAVVPFGTVDPAPISGEVRFFTDFGYDLPLQPEGWLMGAVEAVAGEQTWGSVTVFCGNHVRAWLFDLEGSAVGLIPSQYENGDGVFAPYTEDYGVGGPEYGYLDAAPPLYTGRYADMFGE